MDVQVDHVVVFNADHAVAVGLSKSTHLGSAGTVVLVDEELGAVAVGDVLHLHQVVGEHTLASIGSGQLGLVLGLVAALHDGFTVEHLAHALKDHHDALTAGIHNTSFFQHRQQVGGILQSLLASFQHHVPQCGHVLGRSLGGLLGGNAGNGQDGALGGLHHSLVGTFHALFQRGNDILDPGSLFAVQRLGEAAEQKAGDNAGVAAGAPQHSGGGSLGSLRHGAVVGQSFQLAHGGANGHAHVGAGITVRDREDVQFVHAGTLIVDVVCAGDHGVAQDFTRNHVFHSLNFPGTGPGASLRAMAGKTRPCSQATTSSTDTITRATFRPVACSSSSLTRCEIARAAVEMFNP